MEAVAAARPLPVARGDWGGRTPLNEEQAFWADLNCVFGPVLQQQLPAGRTLMTTGARLLAPGGTRLEWLRYEIIMGGAPAKSMTPRFLTEAVRIAGPVRISSSGAIDQDRAPGADATLPAYLLGWIEPEGSAVWDILPRDANHPWSLTPLVLTYAGDPSPLVTQHRLVATLSRAAAGVRLAVFEATIATQGEAVTKDSVVSAGLVERLTLLQSTARAAQSLAKLTSNGTALAILMTGSAIVGIVTKEELAAAPPDTLVADLVANRSPLLIDNRTPLDQIVEAVRERLSIEPDLLGIVVVADNSPVGAIRTATVLDLTGPNVRGGFSLEGRPVSSLVFRCAAHGEEVAVDYYDPANPPRCSNGDLMRRKR